MNINCCDAVSRVVAHLEIDHVPVDVIQEIFFSYLNFKDVNSCSRVNVKWNKITLEPIISKKMIYDRHCFNPSNWNQFFGSGTIAPDEMRKAFEQLPIDIHARLKKPCPAFEGCKIIDTHMLVWIPEAINKELVNINTVAKLLKQNPKYSDYKLGISEIDKEVLTEEGDRPIKSGWVLMTTKILPYIEDGNCSDDLEQVERLEYNKDTGYRVPKIAEAMICISAGSLKLNKPLFSIEPNTSRRIYIQCLEVVQEGLVFIGNFFSSGLCIHRYYYKSSVLGVAAFKNL